MTVTIFIMLPNVSISRIFSFCSSTNPEFEWLGMISNGSWWHYKRENSALDQRNKLHL